jgi:hypothetical protein
MSRIVIVILIHHRHKLVDLVNIFTEYYSIGSLNEYNLDYGTCFNGNESKSKRNSDVRWCTCSATTNAKRWVRDSMVAVICESISQPESDPPHQIYSYRGVDETTEFSL